MNYRYKTRNTCSKEIQFEIEDDVITNIKFKDGCPGNLSALSVLCDGLTVTQIEEKLGKVRCGRKRTSCAHQLSLAVRAAYNELHGVAPQET